MHLMEKSPNVLSDKLFKEPMKGDPMVIHMRDNVEVVPRRCYIARQTPIHLQQAATTTLDYA